MRRISRYQTVRIICVKICIKYKLAWSMFTYSVIFRSILASAMHYPTITFDPSRPSGEKRTASEYYPRSLSRITVSLVESERYARRVYTDIYVRNFRSPLVAAVQVLLHLCVRHACPLPLRKSVEHSPKATD